MKASADDTLSPQKARWATADAYLFDIDGTLLNVRDATHYFAFHNAVEAVFGVDSHIDGVPVHGNTDIGILRAVLRREGISDEHFEAGLPRMIAHMCDEVHRKRADIRTELCPAIADLLHSLRDDGKLLGVVSGNLARIGWLKLEVAGLRDFFEFGCFSDAAESRVEIFRNGLAEVARRLGPQATACFVGDTPSDVQAARALHAPVIAVATGTYDAHTLRADSPDACFPCCSDLLGRL